MVDARVRPVRASDAEDVYRLRHQPGTLAFTLAMPSERLEQERRFVEGLGADDHVLVAEVGGQVVGMAGLHVKAGKLRCSGEIGMMVRDDVQGRGIGKRLLEALLDIADNHLGLTRVELEVMAGNARAIALYERSGFAYEGCKRSAVRRGGRDEDLLIMGRVRVS
jgi:putative acetyltransferase